jgi:hypothetical protein
MLGRILAFRPAEAFNINDPKLLDLHVVAISGLVRLDPIGSALTIVGAIVEGRTPAGRLDNSIEFGRISQVLRH